ncbi:hypothetical protein [Rhizobium ruizarguesonis]|jgi:hypothetical protein|uniref:hypothetical protein n=1 Tax=Rhizobium ruizarguesonis TaxID=2081791 RepID=UPI001031F017|nr:hypothetical protein [Rhizobium ruizarguesonis]TBA24723.1 hypothetical protein ELH61_02425 [Rhizobium ruizarguesonis]
MVTAEILDFNAVDALIASVSHEFKPVTVRGKPIPMQALAFDDWMYVLQRFPQVAALFDGLAPGDDGQPSGDLRSLLADIGHQPIAAVVAIVTGHTGDLEWEKSFVRAAPAVKNELGIKALEHAFGEDGLSGFFSMMAEGMERLLAETEKSELPPSAKPPKSGRKTASKKTAISSAS